MTRSETELLERIAHLESAVLALADRAGFHGDEARSVEESAALQLYGDASLRHIKAHAPRVGEVVPA